MLSAAIIQERLLMMRILSTLPVLAVAACAATARRSALVDMSVSSVTSHERLDGASRCIYLGKSLPLDPLLAQRLLSDIAPGCTQHATITNVSARGDATPVVSADWPGGNIPMRNNACLIQADLRTEYGALVFSHDGEIGLVCVSVEYIRSAPQWHADLVFMVAR